MNKLHTFLLLMTLPECFYITVSICIIFYMPLEVVYPSLMRRRFQLIFGGYVLQFLP